jgi:hypothetical protein
MTKICPSSLPITIFQGGATNTDTPIMCTLDAIRDWLTTPPDNGLAKYVRQLADDGDELFDRLKTSLPVALFSGHFSYRSNQTCTQYSPLVVIDLDDVDDAAHMRDSMAGDPHIAACFLSPSGRGIKPLVWTSSEGPHTHRHAWATACKYLKDKYEVDPTSSKGQHDVARSCFLGWDAGMWIAPKVEPLLVDTSLIIEAPRDTTKPYDGPETIRENRHQYLTSYTARLASMGLGEQEILSAARVLVATRFDLSDGRTFEDAELERSVQGAVQKFASYDEIKLGQYGQHIAKIFIGEKVSPIVGIVLRTHEDRMRDTLIPPPSLIAGVLNVGGIGSMIAKPGHGKTLVSAELARCIASGEPFAGREVQQGAVIYVCTDSPDSTERRLLGVPQGAYKNIYTVADAPRFPTGFPELEVAMDQVENLRLVILDTWDSNRDHIGGGYSEQDAQIEKTLAYLRKSAKSRQINYIIVHHSTRENGEVARGSIVFDARCDWMGTVEKTDDMVTLKTTKIRDGEQSEVGSWKINSKPHDQCPDGPPIPWLEYQEGLQAKAEVGKKKLAADEEFLKSTLHLLAEWEGPPPSIKTLHAATGASWRGAVQEALGTMRERGWCVPKVAVLTEEGKRAALELV